jgi:hypothetical protein
MVTNTPVGVLRAVVIFPSCLDFAVVHRLLRQTNTSRDHGRDELCDRRVFLVHGALGSNSHVALIGQMKISLPQHLILRTIVHIPKGFDDVRS